MGTTLDIATQGLRRSGRGNAEFRPGAHTQGCSPGTGLDDSAGTDSKAVRLRPCRPPSARSWSATRDSVPASPQAHAAVRWSSGGAWNCSKLRAAAAPASCMPERSAISMASRSHRPFLRHSQKIRSELGLIHARLPGGPVRPFFPVGSVSPRPGALGKFAR